MLFRENILTPIHSNTNTFAKMGSDGKKYDRQTFNYVSHLKELGIIFTVPNDQR